MAVAMAGDRLLRNAVSIGLATGVYAVSFGVLSVAAGFSVAQTCAMSALTFTGASQFTFVSVLGAGGGAAAALPPALLLAGRNAVYALSLKAVITGTPARRALDAQLVIDESTAMAHAQPLQGEKRRAFLATGAAVFVCWNLGTLVGALAGGVLGDPRDLGLDAIYPAFFLALMIGELNSGRAKGVAAAGALIALVLVPFTPPGVPVLAASLATLTGLIRRGADPGTGR
jgi:4-azaleucine resistance transporter AzlC